MATEKQNNQISINVFLKGMNTDISPDMIDSSQYSYAQNIRILQRSLLNAKLDPNSSVGIISPVNRGFEFNPEGVFTGVSRILASSSIGDTGVVIIKENEDEFGQGKWVVYKVTSTQNEKSPIKFKEIFRADDAITSKKKFSIVLHKEQSDVFKVYIADGEHPIMQINILDEEYYKNIKSIHYLISNHIYPSRKIYLYREISGQLPAGQIQYTYRFYKKHGIFSKLAPVTNRIQVFNNSRLQETGNAEGTITAKGYQLQIDLNYYNNRIIGKFDNVQIFRIQQTKKDEVKYYMIADIQFPKNTSSTNHFVYHNDSGTQTLKEYTKEEFDAIENLSIIPQVIESAQGYMFLANIKDQSKIKLKDVDNIYTKTYSYDQWSKLYPCDENEQLGPYIHFSDLYKPEYKDIRDKYRRTRFTDINNAIFDQLDCDYINESHRNPYTPNIIGGGSPHVSWDFVTTYVPLDNSFWDHDAYLGGTTLQTYKSVSDVAWWVNNIYQINGSGQTVSLGITQETYIQNIGIGTESYQDCSYNGIASSVFRSLRRGEVYRYGIIYYDQYGNSSDVQWMDDIVVPSESFFPSTEMSNGCLFARPIGIRINVDNVPDWVQSYQVVRCSKEDKYRKTLYQVAQTMPTRNRLPVNDGVTAYKKSPWYPTPFLTDNLLSSGLPNDWPRNYNSSDSWKDNDSSNYCTILMSPDINVRRDTVLNSLKGDFCKSKVVATYYVITEGKETDDVNNRLKSIEAARELPYHRGILARCGRLVHFAEIKANENNAIRNTLLYQKIKKLINTVKNSYQNNRVTKTIYKLNILNVPGSDSWIIQTDPNQYVELKYNDLWAQSNINNAYDSASDIALLYSIKTDKINDDGDVTEDGTGTVFVKDAANHRDAYNSDQYKKLMSEYYEVLRYAMDNVLFGRDTVILDELGPYCYSYRQYDEGVGDIIYKQVYNWSGNVSEGKYPDVIREGVHSYAESFDKSLPSCASWVWETTQNKNNTSIILPYYNRLKFCGYGSGVQIKDFADVKNPNWNDGFSNYQYNSESRLTNASKKYKTFSTQFSSINYVNWVANWKYDFKVGKHGSEWDGTKDNADWFREFITSNDNTGDEYNRHTTKNIKSNYDFAPVNSGWIGPGPVAILASSKDLMHGPKRRRLQDTVINICHNMAMFSGKTKEEMQYDIYYGFGNYGKVEKGRQIDTFVFDGDVYITPAELTTMYKAYDFISDKDSLASMQITNFIPIESEINSYLDYGMNFRNTRNKNITLEPSEITGVASQSRPQYQYNYVFSCNSTSPFSYNAQSLNESESDFPQRIFYSEKKTDGENIDNWNNIKANNFIDCDSRYGDVTNIKSLKDILYYWQKQAFGKLSVNERSLIVDNANNTIQLGQGGVLQRTDYIDTTYGMRSQDLCSDIIENGVYWIDSDNVAILRYVQEVQNIGIVNNVQSLLNSKFDKENIPLIDYDEEYKEILCNCLHKDQLVFSSQGQFAQSIYTRKYDDTITINNVLYGLNKNGSAIQYNRLKNGVEEQYLTPTIIEFVINQNPQITKVFDNQQINIVKKEYNYKFEEEFMKNKIFKYTTDLFDFEYNDNKKQLIANREGNITYAIPRINGAYYGNRIKGKWLKVRMTDNEPKFDYSISNIMTKYRQSFS